MRLRTSTSRSWPLSERDARRHLDEHHDVALVQLGQELGAQPATQRAPPATTSAKPQAERDQARRASARSSHVAVAPRAASRSSAAPQAVRRRPEQNGAQRRHQREREHQRADQREGIGERERPEDAALDRLQREHRHQRRDDDQHRVERRPRHVHRRAHHEPQHASRVSGRSCRSACITFSTSTTAPSTRMPKSIAPIEIRLAGSPRRTGRGTPPAARAGSPRRRSAEPIDAAQEQPDHGDHQQEAVQQVLVHRARACGRPGRVRS